MTLRFSWIHCGLTVALFLITLRDFYFYQVGLAPFPLLGLCILILFSARFPKSSALPRKRVHLLSACIVSLMVFLCFVSSFWGWLLFRSIYFKGAIGLSFGVLSLLIFLLREDNATFRRYIHNAWTTTLAIHLAFWLVQVAVFLTQGTYFDYIVPITGVAQRSDYFVGEATLIRFTGLFAEPATYSTFVFMGLSVRMLSNQFHLTLFDKFLLLSGYMTLSILGALLLTILVAVAIFQSPRNKALLLLPLIPAGLLLVLFTFFGDSPIVEYLRLRALSPLSDPSGNERMTRGITEFAKSSELIQWFGKGLGNYDLSPGVSNGLAYLVEYFGLIGTTVFVGLFVWLFVLRRVSWPVLLFLWSILLGAPLFTNVYWWVWVGLMMIFCRHGAALDKVQDDRIHGTLAVSQG